MAHRVISGLIWVMEAKTVPGFAGKSRARGAKAQGLRYEAALAKRIPGAQHGKWFEFQDKNGKGWCQPDFFVQIEDENCIFVLECKNSWVPEGHSQLEQLYFPVLEKVFGLPVIGAQVCKHLAPGMRGISICSSLEDAFLAAKQGKRAAWHWIGGTPVHTPGKKLVASHLAGA